MKLALYARVSTSDKGQNPEVQLNEMRAWAKHHGHQIVAEYVDEGISGLKKNRPQLNRMMREATKGLRDIDAVLVWKLDRFGRSLQHLLQAVTILREAGVSFISQSDCFDLTTPAGTLLFNILGSVAQFERDIIAERTRAGLKYAKSQGRIPGRKIDPEKGPSRTTVWRQRKIA